MDRDLDLIDEAVVLYSRDGEVTHREIAELLSDVRAWCVREGVDFGAALDRSEDSPAIDA